MALVFPNRSTVNWTVFPALTALTSSYVAGALISTDEANALCLDVIYIKGDETSIQIKVESTNEINAVTGSNWYQQITQSASGGTVTIAPAIYSMTAASAAATQKFTILINPVKGTAFKVSVQATGGSVVGTYSIQGYVGWV